MRGNGGVCEIGPPAPDRTRVLSSALKAGREDRIAVIDGILCIADQVREAELVLLGRALTARPAGPNSHIFGFTPPRKSVGTHLPRVGAIT